MVKFQSGGPFLKKGIGAICLMVILMIAWGCRNNASSPPFPGEFELIVEQSDSVSWDEWLNHWSVRGGSAMQFEVRALRSLLDEWPATNKDRIRVAWYRTGPDRWSVLLGTDEAGLLPLPGWQQQERSSYRSTTIIRYRTVNGQTVWLARRSGWQVLTFRRSLLQDALLAEPVGPAAPASRTEPLLFAEPGYLTGENGALGFRQKSTAAGFPAFAKNDLAVLPDFLREGWVFQLPARDWIPFTDRVVMATGLSLDNDRDEIFLWISDSTGRWEDWWVQNRTEKGELPGFSHQGIRVDQVLDERWQHVFPRTHNTWMPTPFVVRFNDGWILSNSEEGLKRWMDYVLVQKTFQGWVTALPETTKIGGWTHSDSEFGAQQRAKIGPLLPKGETWFWTLHEGRYTLAGAKPEEGQSELLWQSTDFAGPVQYWQYLANSVWILDQRYLHQWSAMGTPIWRQQLAGDLLGAIRQSQVGEEITWMAATSEGLYAWDVGGDPLTGTPFRPSDGQFVDWTHRLGTDRQLYRFALESTGQIRAITGRGVLAEGWPQRVKKPLGLLTLRTDTEDAVVALGEATWRSYTLDGYDRWEAEAPGVSRQWVSGPESGAALIRVADGRLLQLRISGEIQEVARGIDTLLADPEGRWVASKTQNGWTVWTTQGIGGTYHMERTLQEPYPGLSLQGVLEELWLTHTSGRGIWQMTNPAKPVELPGLPGRIAPLIWQKGGNLIVLTGQGDKVVAYEITPE